MHGRPTSRRGALVLGLVVLAGAVRLATASDHQDTPDVELNPKMDRTDVYAFPGSTPGQMVLVMNSRAFRTPAEMRGASFARRCNCAAPQRQYDVLSRFENRVSPDCACLWGLRRGV